MKRNAHLWLCSARRCCDFRVCVVREICALREDAAKQTHLPLATGFIYSCAFLLQLSVGCTVQCRYMLNASPPFQCTAEV
jgi:hypothetical protein